MNEPKMLQQPSLGDLLKQSGEIAGAREDLQIVSAGTREINRQMITLLGTEVPGFHNHFIRLTDRKSGEAIVLYTKPFKLKERSEQSGKKRIRTDFYYDIGWIGLSPDGLFVVYFPSINAKPDQVEHFLTDDESFLYNRKNNSTLEALNDFSRTIWDFDPATQRSKITYMYLELDGFQEKAHGVYPRIKIKVNKSMEGDPTEHFFSEGEYDWGEHIRDFNTDEGLAIWQSILEQEKVRAQQAAALKLRLRDLHEGHLPQDSKPKVEE